MSIAGERVRRLTFVVKRLPFADLILALSPDGRIAEQGVFSELNLPGSYIHSLRVNDTRDDGSQYHGDDVAAEQDGSPRRGVQPSTLLPDETRKTGDWTTYKYYARALGFLNMLIFALLIISNGGSTAMNSKFLSHFELVYPQPG